MWKGCCLEGWAIDPKWVEIAKTVNAAIIVKTANVAQAVSITLVEIKKAKVVQK